MLKGGFAGGSVNGKPFIGRYALSPQFPQFRFGNVLLLTLAGQRRQAVLLFGRRNAQFPGLLLHLFRPLGEFLQHSLRHSGQFPSFSRALNLETDFGHLSGEPRVKRRLEIRGICFQVPELPGLPLFLRFIPRCVKHVAVRVQMRIRHAFDWAGGEVDKFRPNQIARYPVLIRAILPHPRFGFRLELLHRLFDRTPESIQYPLILGELIGDRDRLRAMEIEIVTDRSMIAIALR